MAMPSAVEVARPSSSMITRLLQPQHSHEALLLAVMQSLHGGSLALRALSMQHDTLCSE